MFRQMFMFLYLLACGMDGHANQFYIATQGRPTGNGSLLDPWDMQTAFNHPAVVMPGDTLWVRGGTYFGSPLNGTPDEVAGFVSRLRGSPNRPIIVRAYPGERVIIDGGNRPHPVRIPPAPDSYTLGILGDHCWFWGLEITNSNAHARSDSASGFRWRVNSIVSIGTEIKLINLIVHDTGSGLGPFSGCVGCEVYGCIIYYNGWSHLGVRGHGEGMYGQNQAPTKYIRDNIVFKQFDSGIILYGTANSSIEDIHLEGNIIFDNGVVNDDPNGWGMLLGKNSMASGPGRNLVIRENYFYNRFDYLRSNNIDMGYQSGLDEVVFVNNYSVGRWSVRNNIPVTNLHATGNTLIGEIYPVSAAQISADSNTILSTSQLPRKNALFYRPNVYEPGRMHIVVYNWEGLDHIEATIEQAGLSDGDAFEIVDVQNIFGAPTAKGVYASGQKTIRLPLKLTDVSTVIGQDVPRPARHTDHVFNVFLLKKVHEVVSDQTGDLPEHRLHYNAGSRILSIFSEIPADGDRIEIYSVSGKKVWSQCFSGQTLQIDFKGHANGMYLVSLFRHGNVWTQKRSIH